MTKLKLILNSRGGNYSDYYDHHFDSRYSGGPVWMRNGRSFPSRRESLETLRRYRIATPYFSKIDSFSSPGMTSETKVVVYTDETYHQGLCKELVSIDQAKKLYPELLATEYIYCTDYYSKRGQELCFETGNEKLPDAISRRYLMIGESAWELEYFSHGDWRSNVGDVEINVLGRLQDQVLKNKMIEMMIEYKSPIFALDTVPQLDQWLCTDLNLAPGMHNSGIRDHVSPAEAVRLIKEFYHANCT